MNWAVCQPSAVSSVKATVPSRLPAASHSDPVCAPVLPVPFQKRTPVTDPAVDGVNAMPSSMASESWAWIAGVSPSSSRDTGAVEAAVVNDHD